MHNRAISTLAAGLLAISAFGMSACADVEDTAVQDRFLPIFTDDFWTWYPWFPANGDLQIHEGETTEIEECLIFDLTGSGVSQQAREQNDPNDIRFEPAVTVEANAIYNPDGELVCFAYESDQDFVFKLAEADGDVLFTSFGDLVFEGDVELPSPGQGQWHRLLQDDLAYTYKKDHIYVGGWWNGDVLATSTEKLNGANPMRTLLIAALVGGQCGAVGIEPHGWD